MICYVILLQCLNGNAFSTKPPFTMEFGVWRDVNFKAAERQPVTLKVSGVLVEPEVGVSDFCLEPAEGFAPSYNFTNSSYTFKSVLTRVPPTTADGFFDVDKCMSAPPNIGIFGLIRQGKGFQKMLDVIEKIHKYHKDSLPLTRLKIVGKPLDLIELAKIINRKFDLVEPSRKDLNNDHVVTEDVLDAIFSAPPNELQKVIEQFIQNIVVYKKLAIIKNLQRAGMYSDGCENDIFDRKVKENNPDGEWVKNPSNLQIFVYRLAQMVPEALPVDIYLDMGRDGLAHIFAEVKYAVKYDEKGWANNASGLINLLAYGTILYTGWGMCTDNEVTNGGKYSEALVLPRGKYGVKAGERLSPAEEAESKRIHYDDSNRRDSDKKLLVRAEDIIKDIIARENGQALGSKGKSPSLLVTTTTTTIAEEKKAAEDDGANASGSSAVDAYFNEVLMSSGDNARTFAQAARLCPLDCVNSDKL